MLDFAKREGWWLGGLLGLCGVVLWATSVPEVFTVDECNYLATVTALRAGSLLVPGTAGLTASGALASFDPNAMSRLVVSTPIAPTAPPLYAPFGLPLSYLGWRWLILLNVLCFVLTAWLVFRLAERHCRQRHGRWVALGVFVLGGFCLDYAQGMWPHMLSVALATAAVWLASRARDGGSVWLAAGAGVLVGAAAGVRYQNVVFAAALGLTLLVWGRRRWAASGAFAAGAALPLLGSAAMNAVRLGSWNPVSKGPRYLESSLGNAGLSPWKDVVLTLWTTLVDYSAHPPFIGLQGRGALPKDPTTGAFLVIGGLKKALLQSAPWAALALMLLLLAWTPWLRANGGKRRELRALSVLVVAVLALFAWAGLERHDGWSFNQRYLLELVPLLAVVVGLCVDGWRIRREPAIIGGALGLALALVPLVAVAPEHPLRQRALMLVPLLLAALLLGAWWIARRSARAAPVQAGLLAAAVGWALVVHVGDDMHATRGLRDWNGFQRRAIAAHLPATPLALVAAVGQKEALCPLHLDHDLVMVDPLVDQGKDVPKLTDELLAAGRRVFVVGGIPEPILESIFVGRAFRLVSQRPIPLAEVASQVSRPAAGYRGRGVPGSPQREPPPVGASVSSAP